MHNRVFELESVQTYLQNLLPRARIGIAHGKMPQKDLDAKIISFLEGQFDILLCTTIIESGVDMPNVNTIIVQNLLQCSQNLLGFMHNSPFLSVKFTGLSINKLLIFVKSIKRLTNSCAFANILLVSSIKFFSKEEQAMEKLWLILAVGFVYAITSALVMYFTNIRPTGWRFWVYDTPAFLAGTLTGYFILH